VRRRFPFPRSAAAPMENDSSARGARQQPEGFDVSFLWACSPSLPVFRFREIHAGQRHSLPRPGAKALPLHGAAGAHRMLLGIEHIDKVIEIDQRPLAARRARIPPPTPASSLPSASFFAMLPESRQRGYRPGRFQLQRERRALRNLPGRRSPPHRNEFSCRTYMSPAKSAAAAATIRKPLRSLQRTQHQRCSESTGQPMR